MKETVSKEILNQYFEENIKKHVVDNVMLSSKKLHELGFYTWVQRIQSGKYGYTGLKDFAEKNGYLINLNRKGKFNSKENLEKYFEKNIKQHIKGKEFLQTNELMTLGFGTWMQRIQSRKYGYIGLKDFIKKNGYIVKRKFSSKEKLDNFFEENIKKHVVDNIMLSSKRLQELGYSSWCTFISKGKYGYAGLKDFAEKNGYVLIRKTITKENLEKYFEENIKQHIRGKVFLQAKELIDLGFGTWVRRIQSGNYEYTGLQDFAKKNGYLINRKRNINRKTISKESLDQYFEENIKQHIKGKELLRAKELIDLGFGTWIDRIQSRNYEYTGLQDFAEKNGYVLIRKTISKESLDQYFEENIKQHIKGKVFLRVQELIDLGFGTWVQRIQSKKYGYTGLKDFAEKNGY